MRPKPPRREEFFVVVVVSNGVPTTATTTRCALLTNIHVQEELRPAGKPAPMREHVGGRLQLELQHVDLWDNGGNAKFMWDED